MEASRWRHCRLEVSVGRGYQHAIHMHHDDNSKHAAANNLQLLASVYAGCTSFAGLPAGVCGAAAPCSALYAAGAAGRRPDRRRSVAMLLVLPLPRLLQHCGMSMGERGHDT